MANVLIEEHHFTPIKNNSYYSDDFPNSIMFFANESLLQMDNLDDTHPDTKCFVFLSQHRSTSKIPALTCHFTGNFNENMYGGRPKELGICYPWLQKQYLIEINKRRNELPKYDIIIEATHHGPTSLKKPSLFVEIGSTINEWSDPIVSKIVTETLLKVVSMKPGKTEKAGIAFGGTHYPAKFNRMLLETEFGLAAIASKYDLIKVEENMFSQMIYKSVEKIEYGIVDIKGLGKERQRILSLIQEHGLRIIKV
jgi:D-aminoacyl-tRNA deacylase